MRVVQPFDSGDGRGLNRLNDAFITLIPKGSGAIGIREYRPNSLVHSFGKFLSKVMASQVTPIIPRWFMQVKARSLRGVPLWTTSSWCNSLSVPSTAAMSLLSCWSWTLPKPLIMSIGRSYVDWPALLLSTASTRGLINGSPGEKFWHAHGLWQGDPMSPLLFVVVLDVLIALFRKAEDAQLFGSLGCWGVRHRLSVYADDVVLLIRPEVQEAKAAVGLLRMFGAASGLRCNMGKSSASLIRCDATKLSVLSSLLVYPIKDFPVRYLGIPLSCDCPRWICSRCWIELLPCWSSAYLESVPASPCW